MTASYNKEFYLDLLQKMLKVNRFEESVKALYARGLIHGTLHLCVGEEASVVGSTAALKKDDYILTTHRGHGECIGKGADVRLMMAEILGRASGTNGGIGGSMHICDKSCGVIGSNGIVGAGVPTACGAALSIRLKKIPDRVSVSFFGDGAANSGAVLESMNLAGAWKLPVIFILEDNHYAVSTPVERSAADPDFKKRGTAFGFLTCEADGNDVLEVYETVSRARAAVLEEGRPAFVILHTYRISGHSRSDQNVYRTEKEMQYWKDNGPIVRFRDFLLKEEIFSENELETIEAAAEREMKDVVSWALRQPYPEPDGMEERVYV